MKKQVTDTAKAIKNEISLILLIVSALFLIGVNLAFVLGKIDKTGDFMQFFLVCVGLYFGRRYVKDKMNNDNGSK